MPKLLILPLLLCLPLCALAQEKDLPSRLAETAEMYFDGRPADALKQYIAISKETDARDAFLNAAFIALEQGNPKQAVDIMSSAYLLYPQDEEIIEFTAEAYLADGQYANAEKFYSQLPGGGERSEFILINLARAQQGMGERKLAERNLRQAAKGKHHTSLSNYLLGELYEAEKMWKKAAEAFGKAVAYDHQFTEARRHYARALEKDKQYNEAYRQYRILRSSSPRDAQAQAAVARLRPKLTKSEKELSACKERSTHTIVKPVVSLEGRLQPLRVALGTTAGGRPSQRTSVIFTPSHPFRITDKASGKTLVIGKAKQTWRAELNKGRASLVSPEGKRYPFSGAVIVTPKSASAQQGATILIQKVMSGAGMTWASVDDKEYRGRLEIIHDKKRGTLLPVNLVNIEEYLMGVMSSEMPSGFR